jgi:hypothetical protein
MDGSFAFIAPSGKTHFIVDKAVAWVEPFSDGLARVSVRSEKSSEEKFGYIDRSGKMLIPAEYQSATPFQGGLAFISHCGQSGYIDKMGRPVWGIRLRAATGEAPAGLDPQPSVLTPSRIGGIAGLTSGVEINRLPASNSCGDDLWTLEIVPKNGNRVKLNISLLRGESFLTEQRIETFKASEALGKKLGATDQWLVRPLGKAEEPIGYVFVEGFGPGAAGFNASVFSPGKRYEVQVRISYGGEGHPKLPFDPMIWAGNVAMQVRAILFGATEGR